MMFLEKLWLAKLSSIAQCGTVTALPTVQFQIAESIVPKAKTNDELIARLKSDPWTPVIYENPYNWSQDEIKQEISKRGLMTLAKIIIKK
jgi:hypothetical protein